MQLELPGLDTPLPPISDAAAVEILDFLQTLVARFESAYADQIHRYYQQRTERSLVAPPDLPTNSPPF